MPRNDSLPFQLARPFFNRQVQNPESYFYSALRFSGANQLLSAQKAVSRQSYGKLRKQKRTGLFFIVSDPPPSFKLKNCLRRTGRGFSFCCFFCSLDFFAHRYYHFKVRLVNIIWKKGSARSLPPGRRNLYE